MPTNSIQNSHSTFRFPARDFKRIETPLDINGYRNYICVVDILDLPDFKDWKESNVRDPKDRGRVPNAIRQGLIEEELFVFMNRGLVIAAEKVEFDNKRGTVEIRLSQRGVHGIIDGGHTRLIVSQEKEGLLTKKISGGNHSDRYIKLELLVGFNLEQIRDIAGARNTSNQVKEQSLLNLEQRFTDLKAALRDEPFANDIAYKEYETYTPDTDIPKPIDVRDIIAMLYMFDVEDFNGQKHPIYAYNVKNSCLIHFDQKTRDTIKGKKTVFDKLYGLLPDILNLHDEIHVQLPELYNSARKIFGEDVKKGAFGLLTGVITRDKKDLELPFTKKKVMYRIPAGFVYPILASFRALIEEKNGKFTWVKGCEPTKLLAPDSETGLKLANTLASHALEQRNPNKTGKSVSYWIGCYTLMENARLAIENMNLKKTAGR